MSPALVEVPFQVSGLEPLHIGHTRNFVANGATTPTLPKNKPWALPAGVYTARQIVEANAPLLEVCLYHLGEGDADEVPAREQLIDNLASNLALGTREASIQIPTGDPSRAELADQAVKIGKTLIQYVRNVSDVSYDPGYMVRSPCEGHLLKPHVSYLMFGPRSLQHLMQIYNEYLHQMVLLRDALLPFENYEEVLIPITPGPKRGVRHIEAQREAFLTEVLTKQIKQKTLLKTAQAFLAPELSIGAGVGFQYSAGLILPAFIAGGRSSRLLRYVPAVLDDSAAQVAFDYELPDYYEAKRTELNLTGSQAGSVKVSEATLAAVGDGPSKQIRLDLQWTDNTNIKVDLGQVARGRRYATFASSQVVKGAAAEAKTYTHLAHDVLRQSPAGLVMPPSGTHIIKSQSKIESLALLGKLYPENIVVAEGSQSISQATALSKKGFPGAGRFVISVEK